MRALVTTPFKGCRDGELHPVEIAKGDTVTGDLAKTAIDAGWAAEIDDEGEAPAEAAEAPKPKRAPKNKAGWVPKNKAADPSPDAEE